MDRLCVWRVGGVHECVLGGLGCVSGVFRVGFVVGGLVPWGVRVGVGCCGGVWFYVSGWEGFGGFVEGLFGGLVDLVRDDGFVGVLEEGRWVVFDGLRFSGLLCDVLECGVGDCFVFVLDSVRRAGLRGWVCEVYVAVREDCLGRVLGWLGLLFNVDPSRISERRVLEFREIFDRSVRLGVVGGAVVGSVDVLKFLLKPRGRVRVVRTPLSLNVSGSKLERSECVVLGDVLDFLERPTGVRYGVRLGHLHGLIVGSSGSGKSTSAGRFAVETARLGVRTVVFDWSGEYLEMLGKYGFRRLIPGSNFTVPLGLFSPVRLVEVLSYYVESLWGSSVSPMQYVFLKKAVYNCRGDVSRIYGYLEERSRVGRRDERQAAQALLNRLEPVRSVFTEICKSGSGRFRFSDLGRLNVVSLEGFGSVGEKVLAGHLVLHGILQSVPRRIYDKPLVHVVLDEGHRFFSRFGNVPSLVEEAYLEYRKFGVMVTVATSTVDLPSSIVSNSSLIIAHRVNTVSAAKAVAEIVAPAPPLVNNYAKYLKTLKTGYAIVSSAEKPQPTLVKIDKP